MSQKGSKKLSASQEDYLEAIYNLILEHQVARSKDIAECLTVSRASVTGALRALSQKGLVHYKPYDVVSLTVAGRTEAEKIIRRHDILESFFTDVLGLDARLARESACKAEHALGQQVVGRLMKYIEFTKTRMHIGDSRALEFERFCKSTEQPCHIQNRRRRIKTQDTGRIHNQH